MLAFPFGFCAFVTTGILRAAFTLLAVTTAAAAARRALRLGFAVTDAGDVTVDNFWRSYTFNLNDVDEVWVGLEMTGVLPVPAFAFRLSNTKIVRAQAAPERTSSQAEILRRLKGIAPPHITFHIPG